MEEEKEIELRSDEVQEILTDVPNWMIRYGITLIFAILLAILALSWFIKYPQVISGRAELTTKNPPAILVANAGGYIQEIHVEENQPVHKNQLIAELRNPIDQAVVDTLQSIIDSFSLNDVEPLIEHLSTVGELGGAQNALNSLYTNLIEYEQVIHDESYRRTIRSLGDQVRFNRHLATLSENQTQLFQAELNAAREKFASDSVLYADGVIAKMTFFNNQSEYFAKRQALLNAQKAAIQSR